MRMSSAREELHRLVDEVPAEELEHVGDYLRTVVERQRQRPRQFRFAGMGEAPPNLGARAKDVSRNELGGA